MKVLARAKINWALNILGKRDDGYHEMDMLMQNIDLYDEIILSPARMTTLETGGKPTANLSKNLITRAANALNEYTGEKNGVRINMKKRIPVRSGLGGGSADCASTLTALNELWNLHLSMKTLSEIGVKLGADVPYCLHGGFCRVRGLGEIIEPLNGGQEIPLVLVCVGDGLSTQAVFEAYDQAGYAPEETNPCTLAEMIAKRDFTRAQTLSANALERPAVMLLPQIEAVMRKLKDEGAQYVRMSGSGSAVYGAFETAKDAEKCASHLENAFVTKTVV